ncbi:hypothetical protein GCM10012290_04330 [Halolactibacillus alkaliphilus]|uniref:DUF3284 domain-containing protein n=1 Tax=Halolactibacillus alkaliphilus TaxID=442899 RepID=A0A511WYW9_9BACI|nr:DUF3284 domain-containing protein [Halolactibacillus alkaliphilus]GEN55933.1 hypothetical protein HAL01_03970 [Halolactibacillus alkaliphilus]GGN65540.1 hypothetical protein GCM10012290_04330 [Halolactibacillus alkaliphilus]SFO65738.1 protein of unknown function [Halolactibacillus alkaliphilus]
MELAMKVNVPTEFFYDTIIRSVLADVKQHTNDELTPKELPGYEYEKVFSKQASAKVKIKTLKENECYEYQTISNKNDFTVAYVMQPIDETSFKLMYSEAMSSRGGYMQKLNDAFVGVVWSFLKKKKFKEMLREIESTYNKAQQA